MHTAYYPHLLEENSVVCLSEEESWHLVKVARIEVNEIVNVINGQGQTAKGMVMNNHPKKTSLKIADLKNFDRPKKRLHIAIAPTKVSDRMEWMMEKLTELGLHEFTPIITERTERKKVNIERLQKIALAACKQSKNPWLPIIHEPVTFAKFMEHELLQAGFIAHCRDDFNKIYLKDEAHKHETGCLLIGPEGDFSPKEIDWALSKGYTPVALATYTLRTETAGIYAQSVWVECVKN